MLYTVERPWLNNKRGESCIPDGTYKLALRESPVVNRTSWGKYKEGWEIQNVPDRTYIMIHPGNWPYNFQGCIGLGQGYEVLKGKQGPQMAVTRSQLAMKTFMEAMDPEKNWEIVIRPTEGAVL